MLDRGDDRGEASSVTIPVQRKIIHIDLDTFYASVEQRDNPALRDKPVAVGGSPEKRGAVAAASYEARQFGVYSAKAYLDVSENKLGIASAQTIAQEIRSRIFTETELTASAGVSVNKFLAKMASGLNKPNGMAVIRPHEAADFVAQLSIEKFHGIGRVPAAKLNATGIYTGAD
jgi:DNA polymerase IV